MRTLSEEIDRDLIAARDSGQVPPEQLAAAAQLWMDYQRILTEVLRLSRENSNVISFDVSIHEKRYVTKECDAALAALLEAVRTGPQATR